MTNLETGNYELENANIAVQSKGRLTKATIDWLNENVGTDLPSNDNPFGSNRELKDFSTGITILGFSDGDIIQAINKKIVDRAIVGRDKLYEAVLANPIDIKEVAGLGIAPCTMVMARPRASLGWISLLKPISTVDRIATSYPNIASVFFRNCDPNVTGVLRTCAMEKWSGSVEMVGNRGEYGGIVDVRDTGRSLDDNKYFIEGTIMKSEGTLIAPGNLDEATAAKIKSMLAINAVAYEVGLIENL